MTIPVRTAGTPERPGVADQRAPGRGFWFMRDIPTVLWLVLTVIATIVHRWLPEPTWLMLHLLMLGAITHAILVWSQHFTYSLTHSGPTLGERRQQNIRLIMSNLGAVLIMVGVVSAIWPLTLSGVGLLVAAVGWHGGSIYRRSKTVFGGKFLKTTRYYVAAAAMLIIGAIIGAFLARGDASANLVLSHALMNVLGWVGLTVAGTVVVLWPTVLRTRADENAATGAAKALPLLASGVLIAALGAALAQPLIVAVGLAVYLVGMLVVGVSLARVARNAPPRTFASLSIGTALLWWTAIVLALTIGAIVSIANGSGLAGLDTVVDYIVPYAAAGFAAQVLVGALTYLIPVALGGGPTPVRTGTEILDRGGAWRVTVANAALVVCALPVPSVTRVVASLMYLVAIASFLPLLFMAIRGQNKAKATGAKLTAAERPATGPIVPEGDRPKGKRAGQATAGLIAVVLATAITAVADPLAMGWGAAPVTDENAPVHSVRVEARDMRFYPNVIEVPYGSRLEIELANTDKTQPHDIVLDNGAKSARVSPGQTRVVDAGVITSNVEAWCSVVGHRMMGMTLQIVVTDAPEGAATGEPGEASDSGTDHGSAHGAGHVPAAGAIDLMADPGAGFERYPAELEPLEPADGPTTHQITLTVREKEVEVAPGVTQRLWMFNDSAPGPVLHGRVGDTFEVTLVNEGTMGHSIDFHAGENAPNDVMRTIAPGESLQYTFTAERAGIWMYHCSTMPMSVHIANGMYGAVVIEPADLPEVDRSYVLVQGEYYLGDHNGGEVDTDAIASRNPDLVTFNGHATQYRAEPLEAIVGERVRVWVLDAGVERPSSFHVVGGQFDTVWSEGRYLVDRSPGLGSQALALAVAQGGFVELSFVEPGDYPFVSHYMIDAERGAAGLFHVAAK